MITPIAAVLSFVCTACTDRDPAGVEHPHDLGGARLIAQFECVASPACPRLQCSEAGAAPAGLSRALLGQNQVKLTSTNVQYDTTTLVFGFDVTLQNLLAEPTGTPDNVTATGSKVFYETGPTATSYYAPGDTGTVTVANADGRANFTGADQPYHFYLGVLQPSAVSAVKRWELRVPRAVKTFSFTVRIFTTVPSEAGVPATPPDSLPYALLEQAHRPENLVYDDPRITGPYPRNLIVVSFQRTATQEERQAAIDLIKGEVIGGARIGPEGFYLVRITDDGTAEPLHAAIGKLEALPQVRLVTPDLRADPLWQRPDGGRPNLDHGGRIAEAPAV